MAEQQWLPAEYSITEPIHSLPNDYLSFGVRREDGSAVLLLQLHPEAMPESLVSYETVRSPNAVSCLAVHLDPEETAVCAVLDTVAGTPLTRLIYVGAHKDYLPEERIMEIARGVIGALIEIHSHGLVALGGLTPSRVFLDEKKGVHIIDYFGLLKPLRALYANQLTPPEFDTANSYNMIRTSSSFGQASGCSSKPSSFSSSFSSFRQSSLGKSIIRSLDLDTIPEDFGDAPSTPASKLAFQREFRCGARWSGEPCNLEQYYRADVWYFGLLLIELCLQTPAPPVGDVGRLCKELEPYYSKKLIDLLILCVSTSPEYRPTIDKIAKELDIHISSAASTAKEVSESSLSPGALTPQEVPRTSSSSVLDVKLDEAKDTDLILAVTRDDTPLAKTLLSMAGGKGRKGRTALMHAATRGNLKAIKLLLDKEEGMQDARGATALMYAIRSKQNKVLRPLLRAELKVSDSNGLTALMWAAIVGNHEAIRAILKSDSKELRMRDKIGRTALMLSTLSGNKGICTLLSPEYGMSDSQGCTALMYAASAGLIEAVAILAPHEARQIDKSGNTAFSLALRYGHQDCADILLPFELPDMGKDETPLMYGIRKNNRVLVVEALPYYSGKACSDGYTALTYAIKRRMLSPIAPLLEAELLMVTSSGKTALDYALENNYIEAVELISKYFRLHNVPVQLKPRVPKFQAKPTELMSAVLASDVTAVETYRHTKQLAILSQNRTALMLAAECGNTQLVDLLLCEMGLRDTVGRTALMQAASRGHLKCVELLLPEICIQSNSGHTALIAAVAAGHLECAKLLVAHEARKTTNNNETALSFAVRNGHHDCMAILLDAEAGIQDSFGMSNLMRAVIGNDPCAFDMLVEREAGIGDEIGFTALMYAAIRNLTEFVPKLIAREGGKQTTDLCYSGMGWTALMFAASQGHIECVRLLAPVEAGRHSSDGSTALMLAAEEGHEECVRVLLEAESRLQDRQGRTALIRALSGGHSVCANLLLNEGDICNIHLQTALMFAAKSRCTDIAAQLVATTAGMQDREGITALMMAARSGATDIVQLLIDIEAGMCGKEKMTALMFAAKEGQAECAELLLATEGLRHNSLDRTALMIAAANGHVGCVRALMPVEVGQKTQQRLTAFLLSASEGYPACARLLMHQEETLTCTDLMLGAIVGDVEKVRENIGQAGQKSLDDMTALMYAAVCGSIDCVHILATVEAKTTRMDGSTALMLAAKRNQVTCVEALVECEQQMRTQAGWTALMFAAASNHPACAEKLLAEYPITLPNGQTALRIAMQNNSHDVVRVLRRKERESRP
ncbi:Ankyrin repeat protein 1 [Giardia muris]|uniref:Ankyrin repeat protein 1 n=1 Tax=Giardia muris TaxID=5742 RepID=A0A4Z1T5Z1_GIAMU|nr:Ankyrin repeat protein 1 [Giardia muris]|eukprot:TNJ27881.1 Ankyrin repeat protein 1 [Giardia muris]